jgi:hypothetical protein
MTRQPRTVPQETVGRLYDLADELARRIEREPENAALLRQYARMAARARRAQLERFARERGPELRAAGFTVRSEP